jgi:hypothetical protein
MRRSFLNGTFRRRFLKGVYFMPIRKYVSGATFGPELIKDMTTAFERIRTILKLEDRDDPLLEEPRKLSALHLRAHLIQRKLNVS